MRFTIEQYRNDPSIRIRLEAAARRHRAQELGRLIARLFAAASRREEKCHAALMVNATK